MVETTNFSPKAESPAAVFTRHRGSAGQLRLVERFTRVDRDTIEHRFTVDDPGTYSAPWTAVIRLKRTGDVLYEYACHEGNVGMEGILAGHRAEERRGRRRQRRGARSVRLGALSRVTSVGAAIAVGAGLTPAAAEAQAALTYYRDVAPIIRNHCQSCHRSGGFQLRHTAGADAAAVVRGHAGHGRAPSRRKSGRGRCPPWFADAPRGVFRNERGLTEAEIATIVDWVAAGAPAGGSGRRCRLRPPVLRRP